jgi:glycosyltransferase involved in cell wall biosynthesis
MLGARGKIVAHRVSAVAPGTQVVVNGGNCAWPGVNWVHSLHHAWPVCDADAPRWFRAKSRVDKAVARRRERVAISAARLVIANSERTRRDLVELLGVPIESVRRIYLGSDPAMRPATPERRAVARRWLGVSMSRSLAVFAGALGYDANKGLDTLVDAWTRLCASADWDADLIVAGTGRGRESWRARIERAGLSERIRMIGFTDRVSDLLAAADVFVSPVRYESYGLNVHESLCSDVPAIVSACAGVAERYPAGLRELLISDPSDSGELAMKLLAWRAAVEKWRELVKPFAAELRSRTWKDMAREIVATVENCVTLRSTKECNANQM